MDPTQKNNLDNAMPNEGVAGNAAGADNSVGISAPVNAGSPVSSGMSVDVGNSVGSGIPMGVGNSVNSGMPMGVGNSVSASVPVNAGRFSALTGAKRYNSSMNAGQFANPARGAVGMAGRTMDSVGQPTFAMGSNQPIISGDAGMDMGNPGMSLNPSMEGLAVNNGGGNKTKKLWIAGGVIGAILVVCIAVVAVVMNNGGGANSPSDSNSEINRQYGISNYKEAVNAFANYILFSQNSTDRVSDTYDSTAQYAIWKAAADKDVGFFNNAKELFDNMMAWTGEAVEDTDKTREIDTVLLDSYGDGFLFYYLLNTVSDVPFDDLSEKYIKEGQEAALTLINDSYEPFLGSSSDAAKRYGELKKEIGLLNMDMIKSAVDNGCASSTTIDAECMNKLYDENTIARKREMEGTVDSILSDTEKRIVRRCYILIDSINDTLESEINMEEGND